MSPIADPTMFASATTRAVSAGLLCFALAITYVSTRAGHIDCERRVVYYVRPAVRPAPIVRSESNDRNIHCKANECKITIEAFDALLENLSALATQARFVPSMRDGKWNGFEVYAIRDGSYFARFGFQNGDTLQRFNGQELRSLDDALMVMTKLRSSAHFVVAGERRHAPFTIYITII